MWGRLTNVRIDSCPVGANLCDDNQHVETGLSLSGGTVLLLLAGVLLALALATTWWIVLRARRAAQRQDG